MFAYLKGVLAKKTLNDIIIDVNGVGYLVFTTASTISSGLEIGAEIKVYTFFYVREDTQALYGFLTEEELKMFERLLTVSGVGPKASLSLVSNMAPSQFALSILTDDIDSLTKAQGIGKKTAQKIILELKDKLKKESEGLPDYFDMSQSISTNNNKMSEAVSALIMLGYSSLEANKAIAKIYNDDKSIEQIIKDALKQQ